jgi:hypothetical protein
MGGVEEGQKFPVRVPAVLGSDAYSVNRSSVPLGHWRVRTTEIHMC